MRLFEPISIGPVTIPNRIVKSAMAEGQSDASGHALPGLARMYGRWARGGVGLAITGMAHIRPGYSFTDREIGLYCDANVEPLRAVTAAAHEHGGRIFAQLCHAPPQLPRAKAKELGAVAPSGGLCRTNLRWGRGLTGDELRRLAKDFGAAARRAREAGFDGVQLHAAHGYLLSRMLSPRDNRRTDRWGGSFEGRLAFLSEVYSEVRRGVGDDYPITIKLNAHDGVRGGLDVETSLRIALGIEFPFLRPVKPVLGPIIRGLSRSVRLREEAYFAPLAERFAGVLSIPVICVGGIRTLATATRLVEETPVAMVSLARPLVRQPGLPRAWQRGESSTAQCTSCNECFVHLGFGQPLRCWNKTA
ncbi:MAG: NADH:flavin oxidoreductase [Deltaproteobacteria bacterium]|nr:NADH:flavin oxidoreductase [Deltaproteobacteria bacterium]